MKRNILLSVFAVIFALCMPLMFVEDKKDIVEEPPESASPQPQISEPEDSVKGLEDSEIRFVALIDGELFDCSMEDYLPGVLAGEMPALFSEEALKAQAVAARTYIIHCMGTENPNHPEADVCDDPSCCKAFSSTDELKERWGEKFKEYWQKMTDAVEATDGEYLTYDDEAILAVFHSSSSGMTEDSKNIWAQVPYLVSVDSPEGQEDVPSFVTTVEVTQEVLKETVSGVFASADFEDDAANWVGETLLNESGRVSSITIGGVKIEGGQLRDLFDLRSTNILLEFNGEKFVFTVMGYGHGVGMSQYGANVMAKNGSDYKQILSHYYPGTTLEEAS